MLMYDIKLCLFRFVLEAVWKAGQGAAAHHGQLVTAQQPRVLQQYGVLLRLLLSMRKLLRGK